MLKVRETTWFSLIKRSKEICFYDKGCYYKGKFKDELVGGRGIYYDTEKVFVGKFDSEYDDIEFIISLDGDINRN